MAGLADVLVEGRLTKVAVRAAKKIIKRGIIPAARVGVRHGVAVAPRVAMTGLRVGAMVARAHPVGAALSLKL